MQVHFLWIGKTKDKAFISIIAEYEKRLKHYSKVKITTLKEIGGKKISIPELKKREADLFIQELESSDYVVLLDERGKHQTSRELSSWMQHKLNISINRIVLIIAGPYGAHQTLKDRADYLLSLSHMTLTHDMARILNMEQVYRAFTILKGEKYHND